LFRHYQHPLRVTNLRPICSKPPSVLGGS
jgi:hypothetical protein